MLTASGILKIMKQQVSTDDVILKMFAMIEEMRLEMATKDDIASVREDIDKIRTILDHHTDMLDRDELERQALGKQVGRQQDWIDRAGAQLDVAVDYS